MNQVSGVERRIPPVEDLQRWRAKALYILLIVLATGGLLAYGTTILDAFYRQQMTPLLWVYVIIYLSFLLLAVLPRVSIPVRAWAVFILAYANAAASLARVGLAGSGRVYLVFVPAAAIILIGTRAGWICMAISLGLYGAFSFLAGQGILIRWLTTLENPLALGFWLEAGASLALFLVTLTVLIERFFAKHIRTLEASKAVTAELERAYEALQKRVELRTRELALLNSVAAVVSGLVDIGEVLGIALRRTMDAFDIEAGGAYVLEPETGTLVMLAHAGLSEQFARHMARLPLEAALAGKQLSMEQPLTWDLQEYPEGDLKASIEGEGLKSIIGAPLAAKGKLVGGFVLDSRRERTLTQEEESLLIAIGQQVGLAIENARHLEMERAQHAEAHRRQEVAEGMRETVAVLNSNSPLQQTLNFIISQACRLMKCDGAALFQLETPEGPLVIQASCSLDPEYVRVARFFPGEGGPGQALLEHKPVALPDAGQALAAMERGPASGSRRARENLERLVRTGYHALLSVPLIVQSQGYGGITLYFRAPRRFTDEEVQLATSIGVQAAMAIENARLRAQAEQTAAMAERNRLARELHDSVTQSLYSVTLYAEAAARMLGSGQAAEAAGHLRDLGTTAREALREMRLLIFELNPPALEKGNLSDALQIRLDAVEARGGVSVGFHVEGTERLTPLVRQELYQIAQEALNNALKHAKAQAVKVRLHFGEREASLEISDDGVGFEPEAARKGGGLGLRGMSERVQKCGGSLAVDSQPGRGTRVHVLVPLAEQGAVAPGREGEPHGY